MTWCSSSSLPLPQSSDTVAYSSWRCSNAPVAFRFATSGRCRSSLPLHLGALPGRCRSSLALHLGTLPGRCRSRGLPLHLSASPGRCLFNRLPLHLNALPGRCRSSTFRSTDTYGVTPVAFHSTFGARSLLPLLLKVSLRDSYAPPGVWSSHHSSQGVAPGLLRSTPYISPSTVPIEQRDNPGWEIRLQAEFSRYDSRGGRNPRKKRG